MFSLKHVVVFFILQNTVSSFRHVHSDSLESITTDGSSDYYEPEYYEYSDNYSNGNSEEISSKICPEEHSLISHSDVKYLIEHNSDVLKIKEHLLNSYYPVAEKIFKKYMGELEEFQEILYDRPEHMLHILHDAARLRQKLEPDVEETATRLERFYIFEHNTIDVTGSTNMLNQLEKYKNMCKINCEEIGIEFRFGHKIDNNPFIVSQSASKCCVRLKDLYDIINNKLREIQVKYDEGLNQQLEIRDKIYAQNITEIKINLKEAAKKEFGPTMYDILSLQDDYHHFVKDFKHVNISSEIYNILENAGEIDFRLIGLHRDLETYRQYCWKCNMDQRVKRNALNLLDDKLDCVEESFAIPVTKITHAEINYLDELIKARIDEISESIESNLTSMFEELDEKFNDPDVIDDYVMQLHPIQQEIVNDIKTEQEALRRLSSRIPEASINTILALSKESKQIIQNLESAKQFIDQVISRNSM